MIKAATADQMRECDRATIEDLGIPGLVLMENASRSVASQAMELVEDIEEARIVIFCGKGNNGGDGFAAARHLQNIGAEVVVYLLGKRKDLKGDAAFNAEIFAKINGEVIEVETVSDLPESIDDFDLAIDAMLGTGFKGEVRGLYGDAIDLLNRSAALVIAVDMPSGCEADTGRVSTQTVMADQTVTFGLMKRGLLLSPARECAGQVIVADISIPPQVVNRQNIQINLIEESDVIEQVPWREPTAHKGDVGHVYMLAGSSGFTGAAAMCARAAMRTGAGLVSVGIPDSLNSILETKLDESMTHPLPETEIGGLSSEALSAILPKIAWAHCVVFGPGIGRDPDTGKLLGLILDDFHDKPLVIDADGLNLISDDKKLLNKLPQNTVLTPHPGEFCRLTGMSKEDLQKDMFSAVVTWAKSLGVTIVLKGSPTLIANSQGTLNVNPTGNPGMASGGSGDVLTGIIASLIAQGLTPWDASWTGVFLHGRAGDRVMEEKGVHGMIAGDIIQILPKTIKDLH